MNKKSDQDAKEDVVKRPMEWQVQVADTQCQKKRDDETLDALAMDKDWENIVHFIIKGARLAVSHPTQLTILSPPVGNGTHMLFKMKKFSNDFEPSKTIISEDISSDVAAIGDEITVLLGLLPKELSTAEEQLSQIQDPGFTGSRGKPIVGTKQELIREHAALQIMKGPTNGAECEALENPDQTAGLQVLTVGLSIVPSTERHNDFSPSAMLPSDIDCITQAMKSKYWKAGINAVHSTLRSKGFSNKMIEHFFVNLESMVAKEKLRIPLHSSINLAQYGTDANGPTQNEGHMFLTASRITPTGKPIDLSSSRIHVTNEPKVTAVTLNNLSNTQAVNGGLLWFESKDDNLKNQPLHSYTNITSDSTVIGNSTEILLPHENNTGWNNNQAGNVEASNLVFQAPQYTKYLVLNTLSKAYPDVLNTTGAMAKPKHTRIINYCQDLRYSGELQKHGIVLDYYRLEVGQQSPDLRASFKIEEALALIHKNDVTSANRSLEKLKVIAVKAENSSLLLGRIYVFMAYIQLRQKDYEEAIKMLDIASYFLNYFASGDLKTFLCYNYGVALMMLAGESLSPNGELEKKALQFFDIYLQHAKIRECCAYFVRKGINCVMFQKAAIYLRIYNNIPRDCQVSTRAVEMAKECLKVVEDAPAIAKEYDTKTKIMFIKSDIAYREGEFRKAENILMEGIALFNNKAFTTVISKEELEERQAFLKNLQ